MYKWKNAPIWLWEKTYFWHSKGAVREITISGRYIVGNESYSIPFHFPKDTEWNFKSETKILKMFDFLSKKCSSFSNFLTKIKNVENFCLRLRSSICTFGKVERDAITFISYDIVTWNRVLVHSCFWISKTRFFQQQKSGIFPLIQFMKVLACCLKGQHPLTKI